MDIRLFREFVTLAELGNFTEAAETLYLSQATLSKHIKSMEAELNESLFKRTTRHIELTEAGKLLLQDARIIITAQQHYEEALASYHNQNYYTVRLGTVPMMPHYGITKLLSAFSQEYPGYHLQLTNNGETLLEPALVKGEIDVALMRYNDAMDSSINASYLMDDRMAAILSKKHPLSSRKTVTLQELKDEQFILLHSTAYITQLTMQMFAESGFTPEIRLYMSTFLNILDLVREDIGITIMPYRGAKYIANNNLALIPITPVVTLRFALCHCNKRPLSSAARVFYNFVLSHKDLMQTTDMGIKE